MPNLVAYASDVYKGKLQEQIYTCVPYNNTKQHGELSPPQDVIRKFQIGHNLPIISGRRGCKGVSAGFESMVREGGARGAARRHDDGERGGPAGDAS